MINYTEKGIGLHEHLNSFGLGIMQIDGVWQSVNGANHDDINAAIASYHPILSITVSPRQIRLALNQMQMRDAVETFVKTASRDVQDVWEFSVEIRRDDPVLNQLYPALGLTSEQVDAIFMLASPL